MIILGDCLLYSKRNSYKSSYKWFSAAVRILKLFCVGQRYMQAISVGEQNGCPFVTTDM
jgi:hypothetical protein